MPSRLLATLLLLFSHLAHGAEPVFVLGVFPYLSRGQLVEFHTPLKVYLETQLRRPVDLVTAPDFVDFATRTRKGEFDLILTAPHLGRLAEMRDGYQRVAMTAHEVQGVFLARKDAPIHAIADLKNRAIVIAQPTSIVYQMAVAQLKKNGLIPGKDITLIDTRTHNNALAAPVRGEADASVTTKVLWNGVDQDIRAQLEVIGATQAVPGHMVMANPRVSAAQLARIQHLLFEFKYTEQGRAYLETTGQKDFIKIDDKLMRQLDPYTRVLTEAAPPPP